jgi:uncharacterized protein YukE
MFGRIFKFLRGMVQGIINQIMQQVNVIQDAVTSPLKSMVSQVLGGVWKGNGAERFANEMLQEVIPALVNIAGVGSNFGGAIQKSMDRMEQAERFATSKVQPLFDVFSHIF